MNVRTRASAESAIAPAVIIRPIQPDHLNDVRYIHATAFRSQAHSVYAPEELDAFEAMVRTPGYVDKLMSDSLLGGWLGRELIATAAWHKAETNPDVSRITALYVRPLFERIAIGSKMLQAIETAAATAGCHLASVRAPINAQKFFQSMGYEMSGRGTRPLGQGMVINVVFMRKVIDAENIIDFATYAS